MRKLLLSLALLSLAACTPAAPESTTTLPAAPTTITINPAGPAIPISPDFLGLSYETAQLFPNDKGEHYFSPDNKPLVALFKTLGVKSLRIGGNSVDRATRTPSEADVDNLFKFARAANVKVIYSVRLMTTNPATTGPAAPVPDLSASAAKLAKYIHEHYADTLDCFAVGNEPQYFKTYPEFKEKWIAIVHAMLEVAPGSKFCAPDTNPNAEWCKNLVHDFGNTPWFTMITEHDYPAGCAYRNPFHRVNGVSITTERQDLIPFPAAESREKLLAPAMTKRYEDVLKTMTSAVEGTKIPYRMSETNSYWFGGLEGASDTGAAALWSLDYLYWWAQHNTRGLNFHTGDRVGGGESTVQSRYTAFLSTDQGFDIHPLSYAMKLFDMGSHGDLVPLTINSSENLNLTAYAVRTGAHTLSVTLINKTHGEAAHLAQVGVVLPQSSARRWSGNSSPRALTLSLPNNDIAAKSGLTLGNTPISPDGQWSGTWTSLYPMTNHIFISLPPASATLVELKF